MGGFLRASSPSKGVTPPPPYITALGWSVPRDERVARFDRVLRKVHVVLSLLEGGGGWWGRGRGEALSMVEEEMEWNFDPIRWVYR